MSESIKRKKWYIMLNTTPKDAKAIYAMIGDGVSELSMSYNPKQKTEQYINADSASTEITSYQVTAPVNQIAKKGDAVFTYINELRKKRATLGDAYSDIIMVDEYEVEDSSLASIPAQKQPCSIQIDSFGGPASDPLSIGYTINARGDATIGTFNATSKEFTEIV